MQVGKKDTVLGLADLKDGGGVMIPIKLAFISKKVSKSMMDDDPQIYIYVYVCNWVEIKMVTGLR